MNHHIVDHFKLIPDADRQMYPNVNFPPIHDDVMVTSQLLQLIVSFRWLPFLEHHLMRDISQWLEQETTSPVPNANYPPIFILIGLGPHHQKEESGTDYKRFQSKLHLMESVLHSLATANGIRVVWFNQFPVVDFLVPSDVLAPKVRKYNTIARKTFENDRVVFWDSGDQLSVDYIRACNQLQRHDLHQHRMDWLFAYYNCGDYVHTGYVILSQTTQVLLNGICK